MLLPIVRNLIEQAAVNHSKANPDWPKVWFHDITYGPQCVKVVHTAESENPLPTGHFVTLVGEQFCMSLYEPEAFQLIYHGPCEKCKVHIFADVVLPDDDWDVYLLNLNHKRKKGGKKRGR